MENIKTGEPRPEEIANAISTTADVLLKLHIAGLVEQTNIDKANMLLGKLLDNVMLGMQGGGDDEGDMEHHPNMAPPMGK